MGSNLVYNTGMPDFVDKLKDNSSISEFMEYAFEKIDEMGDDEILKMSDKRAGEESKNIIRCKKKLYEIFSIFSGNPQKKEPTEDQKKEAKNKFRI